MNLQRVGAFYLDQNRHFWDTEEKGRAYLKLPDPKCLLNLNAGYPTRQNYFEITYEALDNVLRFLVGKVHLLEGVDFVTRRGLISQIMDVNGKEGMSLLCTKFRNVIYLADVPQTWKANLRLDYYGRKFERSIFADEKGGQPDPNPMISNAEAFHLVLKAKLRGYRFLYNAEIDGIDADKSASNNLEDLHLVEAKLRFNRNAPRAKMWTQSVLSGVETIVLGWRDRRGFLEQVETLKTHDLKPKNAAESFIFLDKVMDYIKTLLIGKDDPHFVMRVDISNDQLKSSVYKGKSFLLKEFRDQF